jgi:hypothetical protein
MVGLSASAIANGYAVGAALLALWLFIRYPNQRPQTFRGADDTSSFVWKPTHVGSYRARITAPSRSGYLYITVDEPPPTTTG